ncbi:hypothetical protein MC885_016156 [Smutsia gigantea]|nr:hypothetical protein MC885_016156 [Smutsia gigantea]
METSERRECWGLLMDFKTRVDQACKAAEEFVNIYYETMDKRRQALTMLYLDKASLIWNGNAVTGLAALSHFFDTLPSSQFQVNTLDCQPVHQEATQSQSAILVVTSGIVKFGGNRHFFNQNFLLTAQSTPNSIVWKIASDCFRFQDRAIGGFSDGRRRASEMQHFHLPTQWR